MFVWYKPGPLFDQFRKGSENKARIKDVNEIVGFADLKPADRKVLQDLVTAELSFREGLSQAEAGTEYFVYPKHEAFWSIVVAGSTTRVKWGKVGEDAVLSEKSHADEAAAEKFKDKMVRKKKRNGFFV
jgi:predicted DNA-binding WGR domain protein